MDLEKLEKIAIEALRKAHRAHDELGPKGLKEENENVFGDKALLVDIKCEEAVIEVLRKNKVPIRIYSEEHGILDVTENPIYIGVLDGLDGSSVYKGKKKGIGYGTMFCIFEGLNPLFNDYIVNGIVEHKRKELYCATKRNGSWKVTEDGNRVKVEIPQTVTLDKKTPINIDLWFEEIRKFEKPLSGFNYKDLNSSAVHYINLLSGVSNLLLECTRKGNLELAVGYGIIKEAGGIVMTLDGKEIGGFRYLELEDKDHKPFIAGANREIVNSLIKVLEMK